MTVLKSAPTYLFSKKIRENTPFGEVRQVAEEM